MTLSSFRRLVRPTGKGSILIIALMLISSAGLRIAPGAGGALAQASQLPTTAYAPDDQSEGAYGVRKEEAGHLSPTQVSATADRSEMSGLIQALSARETMVAEREKQLELRLRALSVADGEIEKRIAALSETEASLRATLALADQAAEKDLSRLTSVYESMKPKEAAALFEEMEPAFAAGFLGRMTPMAAADVMAGLSPQVAYTISVILAGRNASAPKN